MNSLNFILLALLALASNPFPTSSQQCKSPSNFTANGTYSFNRVRALSALSTHLIANGGFSNTTAGEAPDRVYAVAFCRPGADNESCLSCVDDTVRDIMSACPYQKDAYWWNGEVPCLVRYSSSSILGRMELEPRYALYNTGDLPDFFVSFIQTWYRVFDTLIPSASSDESQPYAVGRAEMGDFHTIYAFALCMPGLGNDGCSSCLWAAQSYYRSCCYGKQGGVSWRPSCIIRWDLYPYYGIFDDPSVPILLSPPPPYLRSDTRNGSQSRSALTVALAVSLPSLAIVLTIFLTCYLVRRRKLLKDKETQEEDELIKEKDKLKFDLSMIETATENFDDKNKLGQGGFGCVYKGKLPNGEDIAVKRLDKNSQQGGREFKNEVLLMARLEHRNLARLLGYCLEKGERILIYEFVPNSSLDRHLFGKANGIPLSWWVRYKIIGGIARGLLYLHKDSQLRIIHRDLKAGNVLLDSEMNPKISDFGLSKLCKKDESQCYTRTLVGTIGYMAPEYVKDGSLSAKSDVFSFGILVLEILSGVQNNEFCSEEEAESLTSYAWRLWDDGRSSDFFDPTIRDGPSNELRRCLHIGLLCVQGNASKRPTMDSVVSKLGNTISMVVPSRPGFFTQRGDVTDSQASDVQMPSGTGSVDQASITALFPR